MMNPNMIHKIADAIFIKIITLTQIGGIKPTNPPSKPPKTVKLI